MWWMDFSKPRRTGEVLSGELTFKTRLWKLSKHCWVKSGRKRRRLFRKRLHKVKAFLHLKAQCVKRQTKLLIFIGGSDGKESACKAGDLGLIPGSGRSPEEGNYNPLQYSCLENSIDRETWQGPVHGVAKSQTPLSDYHFSVFIFFFLKALPNDGKSTLIIIFLPLWCWIIRMCVCSFASDSLQLHGQAALSMGFPRQEYWRWVAISFSRGSSYCTISEIVVLNVFLWHVNGLMI